MHTKTKFSNYIECEHTNKTKILLYVAISKLNAKAFVSVSLGVCRLLWPDFVCLCVCVFSLPFSLDIFWLTMFHFTLEISKNNIYHIYVYSLSIFAFINFFL